MRGKAAAGLFADSSHRSAYGKTHDVFERHHAAVDDRHAGGDATGLDRLAVVAAEGRATRIV
jgi:hypothetical protein